VDKLILDLHIPLYSYLRESSIVGTAITLSSLSVGDRFVVYNSNIGSASTTLSSKDSTDTTVGIGSEFLDNVYEVDSVENVVYNAIGIGTTTLRRVYTRLSGFSTNSPSGFVTTSTYFGSFSWGKIELSSRTEENQFNFYGNNGVVGITSSALIDRTAPMKYKNYST